MDFKKEITEFLKEFIRGLEIDLEVPKNTGFGDYSYPCFGLAQSYRENANEVAKDLVKNLLAKKPDFIEKIEAKGPYVNFFINKTFLIKETLTSILKQKENYGSSNIGRGKKILVEHTSINPNAPPHIGRARNALIGDSLVRIFKFQGYKTEVHYFINDVGKQIAMLVYAAKNKKIDFKRLLKLYIKVNKEIEKKPELEREIFNLLYKLEQGDRGIKNKFHKIVEICLKGQLGIISSLNIKYDYFDYESEYLWKKETQDILKALEKTGKLFTDEQGRKVLDQSNFNLAMEKPYLVLTRNDGTSLYALRDIAYTINKLKIAPPELNIIVLGEDHKLYFDQLKASLELLNYKAPRPIYYSFVLLSVKGKKGKMSTRKGEFVLLEDFMKETVKKATLEIKKRHKKINKKQLDKVAKMIGYGALKYSLFKVSAEKNVLFDWKKALSFEGDSAPYIQYAYARASSILKKANKLNSDKINYSLLGLKEELKLINLLQKFPGIVLKATCSLTPTLIADYSYDLAKSFNEFYHFCPVIQAEKNMKNTRLALVTATRYVIKNALNLLGIDVIEKM